MSAVCPGTGRDVRGTWISATWPHLIPATVTRLGSPCWKGSEACRYHLRDSLSAYLAHHQDARPEAEAVPPVGLEPTTFGLKVRSSDQLS